jgi:ABC-2 type transport system permease protein
MGWVQAIDPFGEQAIWPVVAAFGGIGAAVGVAVLLAARRDVGAGLIAQRPGAATATAMLTTPLGFAWNLQRSVLVWWTVGTLALGAVYGSVVSSVEDLIEENEAMRDIFESIGMSSDELRSGFVTIILTLVTLIATAGVIQVLLRPRTEEATGRAEPVLSTALSRRAWISSHVGLAALAAPVMAVAGAVGLVLADGLVAGGLTDPGGTLVAALARVPALWAIGGIGVLLYGLAHRFAFGVWAVFAAVLVIFLFGELLRLPNLVLNLSPFRHLTNLPQDAQPWLPAIVLTGIGLVTALGGIFAFERRDLTTN